MIFTFPQKIFLNGQNLSKQKYRPKITYGGEDVNIHAFLNFTPEWCKWLFSGVKKCWLRLRVLFARNFLTRETLPTYAILLLHTKVLRFM
jgi:hypothetical protein